LKIEKVFPTDKGHDENHRRAMARDFSKKNMVSFSKRIPKKHHTDAKHCFLYKKHGGVHTAHYTMECQKYEKD